MKKLVLVYLTLLMVLCTFGQEGSIFSYKHMSGTLGDNEAIFDLVIFKNEINGNSVFPGLKNENASNLIAGERLQGQVDEHGVANLEAYAANIQSGEYSGLFGKTFKGTFREQKNGMARSFSLAEDYTESISFTGYYLNRDSILMDTADSPKAHIELSVLLPEPADSFQLIRTAILDALFGMDTLYSLPDENILQVFSDDYFTKYIESNIDIYDGGFSFNWEMLATSTINMNREGLLVYRVDQYGYTGGAHGMGVSRFLVFDTDAMKQLSLEDIFTDGFEDELGRLLEKEYRARYFIGDEEALTEAGLFDDHIFPSENFFLTSNGMVFFYNPYELAPYSMGSISISLHKNEILHLLKEDAPVKRLGW